MPPITHRLSRLLGSRHEQSENSVSKEPAAVSSGSNILDAYVQEAPSGAAAIEVFGGQWSSRLPPPYDKISGSAELFADARIDWMLEVLGGVRGGRVLELGPLEAGHTYMLDRAGAASITAVEGNTRAFLKCLIVKELFRLERSHFLCGDIQAFLAECHDTYDVCLASGVLYHMRQPVEVLQEMARLSDRLVLWTHYYDPAVLDEPEVAAHFGPQSSRTVGDLTFTEHHYEYNDALAWEGFCGGSAHYANWIERETILESLRRAGFSSIEIGFDEPMTPRGPAFAVVAQRG